MEFTSIDGKIDGVEQVHWHLASHREYHAFHTCKGDSSRLVRQCQLVSIISLTSLVLHFGDPPQQIHDVCCLARIKHDTESAGKGMRGEANARQANRVIYMSFISHLDGGNTRMFSITQSLIRSLVRTPLSKHVLRVLLILE